MSVKEKKKPLFLTPYLHINVHCFALKACVCACVAWTYAACVKGQTCTCLFILPLSFYHHFTLRKPYPPPPPPPFHPSSADSPVISLSDPSHCLPAWSSRKPGRLICSPLSEIRERSGILILFFLGWFYPEVKKNKRGSKCESIKISSSLWREPTTVVLWHPRCILSWGSSLKFYSGTNFLFEFKVALMADNTAGPLLTQPLCRLGLHACVQMSSVSNGDDPPSLSITELNNCNIKHLRAAEGPVCSHFATKKRRKEGRHTAFRECWLVWRHNHGGCFAALTSLVKEV